MLSSSSSCTISFFGRGLKPSLKDTGIGQGSKEGYILMKVLEIAVLFDVIRISHGVA